MNCRVKKSELIQWLLDEDHNKVNASLSEHIKACSQCAEQVKHIQPTLNLIQTDARMDANISQDDKFVFDLHHKISTHKSAKNISFFGQFQWLWKFIGFALIVFVVSPLVFNQPRNKNRIVQHTHNAKPFKKSIKVSMPRINLSKIKSPATNNINSVHKGLINRPKFPGKPSVGISLGKYKI